MSLPEELEKHVHKPAREDLEMNIERLDVAVKRFEEIIELAEDDRMEYFLEVVERKRARAEGILLDPVTSSNIKEQCIGEMRALRDMLDWKKYYLNAVDQAKKEIEITKEHLKTGERPADQPDN